MPANDREPRVVAPRAHSAKAIDQQVDALIRLEVADVQNHRPSVRERLEIGVALEPRGLDTVALWEEAEVFDAVDQLGRRVPTCHVLECLAYSHHRQTLTHCAPLEHLECRSRDVERWVFL